MKNKNFYIICKRKERIIIIKIKNSVFQVGPFDISVSLICKNVSDSIVSFSSGFHKDKFCEQDVLCQKLRKALYFTAEVNSVHCTVL